MRYNRRPDGRPPLLFLELQMMIILHFRRFVGSDRRTEKRPPPSLPVMAKPAWNDDGDDAYNPIVVRGLAAWLSSLPRSEQCRVRRHSHSPHRLPLAGRRAAGRHDVTAIWPVRPAANHWSALDSVMLEG